MESQSGAYGVGGAGHPSADLATELRRLILDLDSGQDREIQRQDFPLKPAVVEPQGEHTDLVSVIQSLKDDLEEANTELIVMVRLLQDFVRVRQAELLGHLERIEQSLQDEINLMEKRIRGDVAALRREIAAKSGDFDGGPTDLRS
jgi:hypothetical protein